MHPDQTTSDTHRYRAADSNPLKDRRPEQDQHADAIDEDVRTSPDAPDAAPDVDEGARVAEAGNTYVGRELDDDLKSSPRVEGDGVEGDGDGAHEA